MSNNIKIVGNPTETSKKMPIENSEINTIYTTAFAIQLIMNDAEKRLNSKNLTLTYERKFFFNQIKKGINIAKTAQDRLSDDYVTAWNNNYKNLDMEMNNANKLAKMLLLWRDRIMGYADREDEVLKFIQEKYAEEDVPKEAIDKFEMK